MRVLGISLLFLSPILLWGQEQETSAGRGKANGIFKDYSSAQFSDVAKGLTEYKTKFGENAIYHYLNHLYSKESSSPGFSLEVSYRNVVSAVNEYDKIDPKDSEALCKKISFCPQTLKDGISQLHTRIFNNLRTTDEGLTKLMNTYPESPYREKARILRDSLRYQSAVTADSPEAYSEFQIRNPGAAQSAEARKRQTALTWTRILNTEKTSDYKAFLSEFKDAPIYMQESINLKLRELKYQQIQEDYRSFMTRYQPLFNILPELEAGKKPNVTGTVEYKDDRLEGATLKIGTETFKPYQEIKPLIKLISGFESEMMGTQSLHLEELGADLYRLEERVNFIMMDQLSQGKRGYSAFIKRHPGTPLSVVAASRIKIIEAEEKWAEEERKRMEAEARRQAELRRQKEEAERKAREAREAEAKKELEFMIRLEKTIHYKLAKKLSEADFKYFVEVAKGKVPADPDGIESYNCGSFERKCEWCGDVFESKQFYASRVTDLNNAIWNPFTEELLIFGTVYGEIMNFFGQALGEALRGQKPQGELNKDQLSKKQEEVILEMIQSIKRDLDLIRKNEIYYCPVNSEDKYCSKKCKYEHEKSGKK